MFFLQFYFYAGRGRKSAQGPIHLAFHAVQDLVLAYIILPRQPGSVLTQTEFFILSFFRYLKDALQDGALIRLLRIEQSGEICRKIIVPHIDSRIAVAIRYLSARQIKARRKCSFADIVPVIAEVGDNTVGNINPSALKIASSFSEIIISGQSHNSGIVHPVKEGSPVFFS